MLLLSVYIFIRKIFKYQEVFFKKNVKTREVSLRLFPLSLEFIKPPKLIYIL